MPDANPFRVYTPYRKKLGLRKDLGPEVGPIGYGMLYDSQSEKIPTVPGQVHSSLFQRVLVHRWQISAYISRMRNYGLRSDYPAAKVQSILPSGPSNPGGNPVAVSRFGRPMQKGTMRPLSRFRKALPVNKVNYTPPEY